MLTINRLLVQCVVDHGVSYVLDLGGKKVFISGDTACTPAIQSLKDIAVAFIAVDDARAMPPEVVACIAHFQPKIVYPYEAGAPSPAASL